VLAKSCKALPIMVVNSLRGGRPPLKQWASVGMITVWPGPAAQGPRGEEGQMRAGGARPGWCCS
jgi:hypothetical protein